MSTLEYSSLCIELDCLFDTRFTTLLSFGEDALKAAIDVGYFDRLTDVFSGVDNHEFNKRYKARNTKTLSQALVTPMIEMLKEFVSETQKQISTTPFHKQPKIILNTYPYVLSDSEANVVIDAIVTQTNASCDVELIHFSIAELTPTFVKQNISILILYEYHEWIEHHSRTGDFKKVTCPEVTLLAPMLYFNGIPSQAVLERAKQFELTPFSAVELLAGPLIGLKLLPVESFSNIVQLRRPKTVAIP